MKLQPILTLTPALTLALALPLTLTVAGLAVAPAAAQAPGQVSSIEKMPPEMAHATVRGIQKELNAHGYAAGPVDGVMGPQTRSAIRQYQQDAGLAVTGQASKELLDHLKFAEPAVRAEPRRDAPESDLVREVQRELRDRELYDGPIDGIAGPDTRDAVRRFQTAAGLPVTGVVDRRLLGELEAIPPFRRKI